MTANIFLLRPKPGQQAVVSAPDGFILRGAAIKNKHGHARARTHCVLHNETLLYHVIVEQN